MSTLLRGEKIWTWTLVISKDCPKLDTSAAWKHRIAGAPRITKTAGVKVIAMKCLKPPTVMHRLIVIYWYFSFYRVRADVGKIFQPFASKHLLGLCGPAIPSGF